MRAVRWVFPKFYATTQRSDRHSFTRAETQVARVQPASRLGADGTSNSVSLTHMDFKVTSLSTIPIIVMFVPCF